MLQANLETSKFQESIMQATEHVKNMGFENIRSRMEGYDDPATLRMLNEDKTLMPDITATKNEGKFYFEIADRTESKDEVAGKWKMMATLAQMKNGDLRIFVPYGSMKYTSEILEKKAIAATIIKLPK